jgi:hypothetical protein
VARLRRIETLSNQNNIAGTSAGVPDGQVSRPTK